MKVFLHDGKIIVLVKGKRRLELQCETSYDDGNWHYVSLSNKRIIFHPLIRLLSDSNNCFSFIDKTSQRREDVVFVCRRVLFTENGHTEKIKSSEYNFCRRIF